MESEPKLCECGCGKPAPIAKMTARRLGHVKGQPVRFIKGHWARTGVMNGANHPQWIGGRRVHESGYVEIRQLNHQRARGGYVFEHIIVAEKALGRGLPIGAEVHHVNEVRADNGNGNLVICQDRDYHQLLHLRMRAFRGCGDPLARQCWICKGWGRDLRVGKGLASEHRGCGNAYRNKCASQRRNK